jgi:type I restriction enzyme R subunit
MSLQERDFEGTIFDSLRASRLYIGFDDRDGLYTKSQYSKTFHCDLKLLADYIEKTQPTAWKKLQKQYPENEAAAVAAEINKLRPKRGLLELLRNGFSLAGVGKIELLTFRPATEFNPAHREKYEANRFAIVRQFHFSDARPNDSIDLVILINGLPLLTIEVKNEFTGQTWQHAEQQYRRDRSASDPFLRACVVHFAVDNTTISMTTKLENGKTHFLPFNRELKNPPIEGNFATAYLWEDVVVDGARKPGVLRADSLLDLLQNFLHLEEKEDENTGKITKTLIFPRYHQLDAVRMLVAEARTHGPGENYLIQHSAGSGKSNTISWLAHQLAKQVFNTDGQPTFDSIIIITDRQVLDKQLQDTVFQFDKTPGLVQKIDKNTKQLVSALSKGTKIIVCTLQKFSWMRNVLGGPKELKGKKFAIIVDEAHSSQTGEGSKDLKLVLTTPEALKAIIDKDDENAEWTDPVAEELARIMKGRQRLPHLSFFAFTATPKPKTLEVFGKVREVKTPEGVKKLEHKPIHVYTMRQAIEEGFILDVLQNYTTYSTYFELMENEKAPPGYKVETEKGRRLLMRHIGKHPHTIESKTKIMLEHFFSKTVQKIDGQAKAMIVTSSRAHAVLYKQTVDRLLREDYASQTRSLVAFSGKVTIKDDATYTEDEMNPADARDIREAFKKQKYRILIVANKFQTGFDQPLLHTMYVDKKLGGVSTVQTLSRLNRKGPPSKQDTMVLDFVNKQEQVEADFIPYYGETTLDRGTDPQKLYNLKFEVEALGLFTAEELKTFGELFVVQKAPGQKISPLFTKIVQGRFSTLKEEEQQSVRDALRRYVSQYSFISQIISWVDPELEKFYLFTKLLLKYLPPKRDSLPVEILEMVDMDKFRLQEQQNGSIILSPGNTELQNRSSDGHVSHTASDHEPLEVIVKELNERYHFDFEDRDKVMRIVIPKLAKDQGLVAAFQTENLETLRKQKFSESLENAFIASASDFYTVLNRMSVEPDFKRVLTEFALTEFRRKLQYGDTGATTEGGLIDRLSNWSRAYVRQHFGEEARWAATNSAVWAKINAQEEHEITLSDVDDIAKTASVDADDVLAVLALLSRSGSGLLEMQYASANGDSATKISKADVIRQLKAWWKDKTMQDDDWRAWAGRVIVRWRVSDPHRVLQ